MGPLRECNGMKYIATAVCYFTKFVEAKQIPGKCAVLNRVAPVLYA